MALGFGFNKAKVLAQAEKFVQQGKLSNAISEYEKIIKEDPKDLTVLNTIGDLYARVGNDNQATYYFKKVGDQYAQNGFVVKAIAIYKKLTKIGSFNSENTTKLAELYGQQGLFNDARVHYMQVADHLLKSGDNSQAARIFQKILELDPENAHTQAKLADLYQKLGKKDEARNIYYSAAESLYARGSHDAAEEALAKVLTIDPGNTAALMLRGMIAVDTGDSHAAVEHLEQVADLNNRPDGLRALLRAKLQTGSAAGVEEIAEKLLATHNDATGIATLAQWCASNNQIESALRLYERHVERLFAGNTAALRETLLPLAGRAKDNPAALAILNRLTSQPGDHALSAEMIELQAHAAAQKGNFAEARDLYKRLTEMEPENALHAQSYKQMLVKLGEDSASRILSPEEAAQAFMVEELDENAPSVHQNYDPPTERAIESALTDAELYVSYNVPSKAIPPLEAALPLAPQDVNLNQRLATLYARAERYADAARMYQNLSQIYEEAGHPSEAAKYLEAAKKYALRTPAATAAAAAPAPAKPAWPPVPAETKAAPAPPEPVAQVAAEIEVEAAPSVQEFTFDTPEPVSIEPEPMPAVPIEPEPAPAAKAPLEPVKFEAPAAPAPAAQHEIDISNEWEEMIEVEPGEAPAPEIEVQSYQEVAEELALSGVEPGPAATPEVDTSAKVADKVQEIHFYITQEMWEPAKAAILDLTELAPDAPEITELIAAVSAGQIKAKAPAAAPAVEEAPVAFARVEIEAEEPVVNEPPPPPPPPAKPARMPVEIVEPPVSEPPPPPPAPPKPAKKPVEVTEPPVSEPAPPAPPKPAKKPVEVVEPVAELPPPPLSPAKPARKPSVPETVLEAENVLDIEEPPKAQPKAPPAVAASKSKTTEDILSDFVLDLEQSDLADFAPKPPAKEAAAPPPPAVAPALERRSNGDMQDAESANVLSNILSELQEETAEAAEPQEDPETHYNLGIAFKEMGLLDEAIGELQKVCHAVDRGAAFSQPIQALTWLAQCLVDKGAPEAAVRWYQKALHLPGLDDGSRCAIHYDLASAYQASGDNKSALANFMEVYGSNIDFRDVASRIKALKS
jgi:tetratricopeptide (TPR) repeat protein